LGRDPHGWTATHELAVTSFTFWPLKFPASLIYCCMAEYLRGFHPWHFKKFSKEEP
jgi:hypothetical protein